MIREEKKTLHLLIGEEGKTVQEHQSHINSGVCQVVRQGRGRDGPTIQAKDGL